MSNRETETQPQPGPSVHQDRLQWRTVLVSTIITTVVIVALFLALKALKVL